MSSNNWKEDNTSSKSIAGKIFSSLTIALGDDTNGDNDLPLLFKDPTDSDSIFMEYYPSSLSINFASKYQILNINDDIEDPFKDILYPPPQFS